MRGSQTYRPPAPPITIQQIPFEGIVHEARHADGPVHSCDGKDELIDELASFGAQYYLLKWIADYSHESQETRDYANYRAWELRSSGGAFCYECQRSGSGKATLGVTITPSPILAVSVGSAGWWGAAFECRITETAGVDVTIVHVDFTIRESATGRVASQQTLPFGTTIRAWSSLAVDFNMAGGLRYSASGPSHEATLSVVVEAKDANGNTITQSASADIK